MKVLLTGGTGQVGTELQRGFAPVAELVVPGIGAQPRVDLADAASLEQLVAAVRPDLVINAAAYTAVDKAENEPVLAHKINAEAPGILARAAARISAPFIHYSTDYVFDGSGTSAWREDDVARPLNVYGASKLAGEETARAANPQHLILRTAWVHAPHGKNFARTMLRLAGERDRLQVVDDQCGAPTAAELIASGTVQAAMRMRSSGKLYGTYHLVASGETSWCGYARHLLQEAQEQGLIAKLPEIEAVTSDKFPTPARRPQNSRLANQKFQAAFEFPLPDWKVGVDKLVHDLRQAGATC